MIDSNYRSFYQKVLISPVLKWKWMTGLSPSAVTFLALFCGALIPFFLFWHAPYWALLFLALSGFLDTLDGSLARFQNKTSPKGAVLDITSDRCVEFLILLGLYLYAPEGRALLVILMLGSILLCVTTFLVVGIFQDNQSEKSFHYSPGLMERSEAFIFFALMILFPGQFLLLSGAFICITFLTATIRIKQFINS